MNIETLQNLKIIENDHILEILVVNEHLNISLNALKALQSLGNITLCVYTPIEATQLYNKFGNFKNYSYATIDKFPIKKYDILLASSNTELTIKIIEMLHMQYVCFFNNVSELKDYVTFSESCFKYNPVEVKHEKQEETEDKKEIIEEQTVEEQNNLNDEKVLKNYHSSIAKIVPYKKIYDSCHINYLKEVVPGKTTIIMIISRQTNKFADTLRALRAQKVDNVEYIIIDNAVGYRNNVKPDIKYGEKMPDNFCIYHGKELSSGEYIFILNQDSDPFDICEKIINKEYIVR